MKKFDYSFLDNGLLPANLINITGTIYSLKTGAKIRKDEYERIFTELEKKLSFIISTLNLVITIELLNPLSRMLPLFM